MINITTYDLDPFSDGDNYTFTFMSEGNSEVLKAIRYTPISSNQDRKIYNLGFGDVDPGTTDLIEITEIDDKAITNNGDHYSIFGTVLSSIPLFFDACPTGIILIRGSDSYEDFPDKCRLGCTKMCNENVCKNFGRRIRAYCLFASLKYEIISEEYFIYGVNVIDGVNSAEPFVKYKRYDALLIYKK
jgi:hypothetical protein